MNVVVTLRPVRDERIGNSNNHQTIQNTGFRSQDLKTLRPKQQFRTYLAASKTYDNPILARVYFDFAIRNYTKKLVYLSNYLIFSTR